MDGVNVNSFSGELIKKCLCFASKELIKKKATRTRVVGGIHLALQQRGRVLFHLLGSVIFHVHRASSFLYNDYLLKPKTPPRLLLVNAGRPLSALRFFFLEGEGDVWERLSVKIDVSGTSTASRASRMK